MHRLSTVLPVLLLLAAGCGGTDSPEPTLVTLADIDFTDHRSHHSFPVEYGQHHGLHWFAEGWANKPAKGGVWSLDDSATVYLQLAGRRCELEVVVSTSPDLDLAGQSFRVEFNGRDLAGFEVERKRDGTLFSLEIPDDLMIDGINRVVFRPTLSRPDDPDDPGSRRLALFFKSLRACALLDRDQLERWNRLAGGDGAPEATPAAAAPRPDGTTDPASRPDILMILLDAARPDHFGCYGYDRDTTPFIDELAAGGLHFTRAFSVAPSTRCAMPSLMTGRHWHEHGVLRLDDALASTFDTLPEILSGAGYRTIGYTENANFSRSSGGSQGFNEFTETWTDTASRTAPDLLSDRLTQPVGPEPHFCFVHLIPPHEPYRPAPEHDLWSDSEYDGPVRGKSKEPRRMDRGEIAATPENLQHMVDLYDGNLHMGDAWVRRMVARWQGLERDRELLVVILADHGEAFGDHGNYGHNSTVYDEMTRIPLVFWPRELCGSLAPATDNLLAITDVMPLILNAARVPLPGGGMWPRRFLDVLEDPDALRRDILLRRPNGKVFGLRLQNHLFIYDGWTKQELYDMAEDPAARRNLRLDEAELYTREVTGMWRRLSAADTTSTPATATIGDADRERLRALGY